MALCIEICKQPAFSPRNETPFKLYLPGKPDPLELDWKLSQVWTDMSRDEKHVILKRNSESCLLVYCILFDVAYFILRCT